MFSVKEFSESQFALESPMTSLIIPRRYIVISSSSIDLQLVIDNKFSEGSILLQQQKSCHDNATDSIPSSNFNIVLLSRTRNICGVTSKTFLFCLNNEQAFTERVNLRVDVM